MTNALLNEEERAKVHESICYPASEADDYRNRFNALVKHTKSDPSILIDWNIHSKSEFVRFMLDNFHIELWKDGEYRMIIPLGKKVFEYDGSIGG